MFSKKKLFIFHNKKVVDHLEQQSNQSSYVENLILNNINNQNNNPNNTNINSNVYHLLNEIKQQITKVSFIPIKNEEIELNNNDNSTSSSIMNILNFK
jgi:hypothetical protein